MPRLFRGWTVRRAVVSVVVALIVVGLYLTVVITGVLDDHSEEPLSYLPGELAETVVWLDVRSIEPATETLDVNVTVFPAAGLLDEAGQLTDELSVRLHPAAQQITLTYPRAREVSTATVQMIMQGSFEEWPFDGHETRDLVVEVVRGKAPDNELLENRVVVTGSVPEWQVDRFDARYPTDGSTTWNLTLRRDAGAVIFAVLLCLVLVSLPVMALYVAVLTVQSKRPFYPPMIGWFAIMLFAVIPLRNLLPGAPPVGGWIDRAVVIWVLAALAVAQGLYVYAWWKEARKP